MLSKTRSVACRCVALVKEPTGPPPARPPEARKSSDGKGYVVRKEPTGPPPARPPEASKRSYGNLYPISRKEPTGTPPARPSEARKRSDGKMLAIRSQRICRFHIYIARLRGCLSARQRGKTYFIILQPFHTSLPASPAYFRLGQ